MPTPQVMHTCAQAIHSAPDSHRQAKAHIYLQFAKIQAQLKPREPKPKSTAKPTANRTLHTTVQRFRSPSPSPATRMANTQLGTQAGSAPPPKQSSTSKARKPKKAPRSPREQQAGGANPPTPTVRVTDEHLARGDTPDAVDTSAAQQQPLTIVASHATDKRVHHIRLYLLAKDGRILLTGSESKLWFPIADVGKDSTVNHSTRPSHP